jgi:hypothetical protein
MYITIYIILIIVVKKNMSGSAEWMNRSEHHRYSQDDKMLSYKYSKEIDPIIDKFLTDQKEKSIVIGQFDSTKEPWKILTISQYCKYNLKMIEIVIPDQFNKNLKEYSLHKQKLSRNTFSH